MTQGDMDAGAWSCGMVAGLIHDIPTCKELISRIMVEAKSLIKERLNGFFETNKPAGPIPIEPGTGYTKKIIEIGGTVPIY